MQRASSRAPVKQNPFDTGDRHFRHVKARHMPDVRRIESTGDISVFGWFLGECFKVDACRECSALAGEDYERGRWGRRRQRRACQQDRSTAPA